MKKVVKSLMLLLVIMLGLALASCNTNSLSMPKPKGKQVFYTNFELTRKLDKLKFENKEDKLIEILEKSNFHEETSDEYYGGSIDYTAFRDFKNNDLWMEHKYSNYDLEGKISASVKGYESLNYTYFDINYTNNKKFVDEDDNIELYNGKYKIKKAASSLWGQENSLFNVLRDYNVYFDEDLDFEEFYYYFNESFFLELNELGYKNLKFYESNNLLTIELKISLKDLKNEKDDFYDIINDWFSLPDDINDLKEFDVHYVFVFDRNYLVELGYKQSINLISNEIDDVDYVKRNYENIIIIKYTDKKLKEFKYSEYELIEESKEILK